MDKQNIDFKLEAHVNQEKTLEQISVPISSDAQNKFAWLIFIPIVALIFLSILDSPFKREIVFFIVAIISIFIYGRYAFEIHHIDKKAYEKNKWNINNQYWLNGLGAFVGWAALYILLFSRIGDVESLKKLAESLKNLGKIDLILSVVAFLGITGYIPYILLLKNPFGKILER